MKGLWSPGKNPMHTVHVEDVAAAAYVLADWMAKEGKAKANEIAGEEIPSNDKGKTKAAVSEIGEGFVLTDRNKKLVAPIFNLVSFWEERSFVFRLFFVIINIIIVIIIIFRVLYFLCCFLRTLF